MYGIGLLEISYRMLSICKLVVWYFKVNVVLVVFVFTLWVILFLCFVCGFRVIGERKGLEGKDGFEGWEF